MQILILLYTLNASVNGTLLVVIKGAIQYNSFLNIHHLVDKGEDLCVTLTKTLESVTCALFSLPLLSCAHFPSCPREFHVIVGLVPDCILLCLKRP